MIRLFLSLCLILFSTVAAVAQQIQIVPAQVYGPWHGTLEAPGTRVTLVFRLSSSESGELAATMDIPGQSVKGMAIPEAGLKQDSLYLRIPAGGIAFAGKLTGTGTINGSWKQSGMSFPLALTKGEVPVVRRPQMPVPPYPYQEQEVTVENKAAGITLAGTLSIPTGKGKHPAVILFTGSGKQDRDMTLLEHKPFLVLADHLTRQGFAVLRLDDRGAGKSGGNATMATTQDFVSDAQAAYTYLKTHQAVNLEKIGLLGISEGALIASSVAATNKDVAFVVLMAGSAGPGVDLLVSQNEAILKSQLQADELQKYLKLRRAQFEVAASNTEMFEASQKIRALEQEARASLTDKDKQLAIMLSPQAENAVVAQIMTPWMRYFLAYDPAPALQQLKMPVLALNGSKDLQVPAAANLVATEKALKAAGNKRYTIKELPGLNHIFQTADTGQVHEYGTIEETMAPVALETISTWMKGVMK
ncbi:alpha/beta fold hydrolase [Pontibacter sp. HSC-14F20]|uniref:alpha/beta hydrolase n=1 Tax=Pontibacter sp. HSC-14F20 TaxID=2864136 RepID=UPI001C72E001|nr:alpha/beta fold hydrolase [Pontibacter sp. HSC-14F20]MBX0332739.1 alpha/beta fold hydrolase [Pontibacter sp. HSC-14F20]